MTSSIDTEADGEPEGFDWPFDEAERADILDDLAEVLAEIHKRDTDYEARYFLVLVAMQMAYAAGLDAGIRIDPQEPDWPVCYIELPTGQVSWHMPGHKRAYDGHTTEEKYARIEAYIKQRESQHE